MFYTGCKPTWKGALLWLNLHTVKFTRFGIFTVMQSLPQSNFRTYTVIPKEIMNTSQVKLISPFPSLCQLLSCFLSQWIRLFRTFRKVITQYMDFWLASFLSMWRHESVFFPLCYAAVVQCAINIFTALNIFLILSQYKIEFVLNCISLSDQALPWPPHLILKELLTPFFPFFLCLFWIFVVLVWFTYTQDVNTSGIFLYIPREIC